MDKERGVIPFAACLVLMLALLPVSVHARAVRMCSMNWPPFYAEDLPGGGFLTELVQAEFKRTGHPSRMEFMPWPRAMLDVRQGDRHLVFGAYYDEERSRQYHYSDPIYTDRTGLITLERTGIDRYRSLRDVAGRKIGYIRGGVITKEFDRAG